MTTPGLAPPPAPARRRRVPSVAAARRRPVLSSPSLERGRRPDRWSLLVSLVIHLLAFGGIVTFLRLDPSVVPLGDSGGEAVEYIDLNWPQGSVGGGGGAEAPAEEDAALTRATGDADPITFPTRVPRGLPGAGVPAARPGAGGGEGGDGGAAAGAGRGTGRGEGAAGGRLRPGYRDPRLYVAPEEMKPSERSAHEKYVEHLHSRIDAVNDSLYGRAGPNTDWTFRDRGGNRWGISEDGVHLGPITIPDELVPLPVTGTNQEQEEARTQRREREEIQRDEELRERRRRQREAVEETRRRREAERAGDREGR